MSPAHKKRKPAEDISEECLADLSADLDLEILLRQRLVATLGSRITWALLLQQSLTSGDASTNPDTSFKDAAIDALDAIDAPCHVIFSSIPNPEPPEPSRSPTPTPTPNPTPLPGPPRKYKRIHEPTHILTRTRNAIQQQKSKPKFLYFRTPSTKEPTATDDETYILTCPACLRTSFTSLQGLLNHARIAHKLEWGSHDECIRACAVPFSRSHLAAPVLTMHSTGSTAKEGEGGHGDSALHLDLDIEGGIQVGGGRGWGGAGVLPGLRSLFQMAVGDQALSLSNPDSNFDPDQPNHTPTTASPPENTTATTREARDTVSQSTHLSRTLGLHKDTPALAHFLGKNRGRGRGIRVFEESDGCEIDIDGFGENVDVGVRAEAREHGSDMVEVTSTRGKKWRMPFAHRNVASTLARSEGLTPHSDRTLMVESIDGSAPGIITSSALTDPDHSTANPSKKFSEEGPEAAPEIKETAVAAAIGTGTDAQIGSRFHIVARIILADRSFWIPPERRVKSQSDANEEHTHHWMISVDAPSYSHHITSILSSLRVSAPGIDQPLVARDPPFVVVGTASKPFVASVELQFVGPGEVGAGGQKVFLEHWVELDPMKAVGPVMGEEQVVDVELDRGTVIKPARRDYVGVGARILWDRALGRGSGEGDEGEGDGGTKEDEGRRMRHTGQDVGYAKVLKGLVPKFPMTLKDVKGRAPYPALPYKLVASPAQFKNLVLGRRKAIEWGRARALCAAYNQVLDTDVNDEESIELVRLTTADIFVWLEDEGLFPRSMGRAAFVGGKGAVKHGAEVDEKQKRKVKTKQEGNMEAGEMRWCAVCGIGHGMHPGGIKTEGKEGSVKAEGCDFAVLRDNKVSGCEIVPKVMHRTTMPMIDIRRLVVHQPHQVPASTWEAGPSTVKEMGMPSVSSRSVEVARRWVDRDLVATSDPHLTLAVRRVVQTLNLPKFTHSPDWDHGHPDQTAPAFPLDQFGSTAEQVDAQLAPYALLAVLAKSAVRVLVDGGLEVAARDQERAVEVIQGVKTGEGLQRRKKAKVDLGVRTLTPGHILRGVVGHGGATRRGAGGLKPGSADLLSMQLGELGVGMDYGYSMLGWAFDMGNVDSGEVELQDGHDIHRVVGVKVEDTSGL